MTNVVLYAVVFLSLTSALLVAATSSLLSIVSVSPRSTPDSEVSILRELYASTNGSKWNNQYLLCKKQNSCWFSNTSSPDPCGVKPWFGISCNNNSHITELRLMSCGLTGTIPENITQLAYLSVLTLADNEISREIPATIGNLKNLVSLKLYNNTLSGCIPPSITQCKQLVQLDLSDNNLECSIPSNISELTALNILSLEANYLEREIPSSIGQLTQLASLDLSSNNLTGNIPSSIGDMTNLVYLVLAENMLNGSIPDSIGNLQLLQKLILSFNHLSGELPDTLAMMNSCRIFDVSNNKLSGELPYAIYLLANIAGIDLSNNNFTGAISPLLQELVIGGALALFDVSGNLNMKSPTNKVPPWLSLDSIKATSNDQRIFYCAAIHLTLGVLQVYVSPQYFNYSHCQCARSYFGVPPDCKACPVNGNCSLGGDKMYWGKGYYPIINKQSAAVGVVPCANKGACCPSSNCSLKYNKGITPHTVVCEPGSQGRVCSQCLCPSSGTCYFDSGHGVCERCISSATLRIRAIISVAVIAAVAVVAVVVYKLRKRKIEKAQKTFTEVAEVFSTQISSGVVKIMLIYLQITASLNITFDATLLSTFRHILSPVNVQTNAFGLPCVFQFLSNPRMNFILKLLLPIVSVLVVFLIAGVWKCLRMFKSQKRNSNELEALIINSGSIEESDGEKTQKLEIATPARLALKWVISVLYFFYFDLANQALSVFNCIPEPFTGIKYMESLPWLDCGSAQWCQLRLLAIVAIVFYVLGIPLFFFILLWNNRHKANAADVKYWLGSNLYQCYKGKFFWFELVLVVSRLLLAVSISFFPLDSVIRTASILFILLGTLLFQQNVKPFINPKVSIHWGAAQSFLPTSVLVWFTIILNIIVMVIGLLMLFRGVGKAVGALNEKYGIYDTFRQSIKVIDTCRRLASEEGIFSGFSAGANVCAALKLLSRDEFRGKTAAGTLNDSGLKYLSTDLWT